MRVLESSVLFYDIISVFIILFLCTVNLLVFVSYQRSAFWALIHISSFFLALFFLCGMIDNVILNLPHEKFFQTAAKYSIVLFIASAIVVLVLFFHKQMKGSCFFLLPPNLKTVFLSVEDLAFIVDYKGDILEINHPEKLQKLSSQFTINGVLEDLKIKFCGDLPQLDEINTAKDILQLELYTKDQNEYYQMVISPIVTNNVKIGFSVLFVDISAIRQSEITLETRNNELKRGNEALSNYVKIAGALEAQTERLHILQNILSQLIHKIEISRQYIQKIQNCIDFDKTYGQSLRQLAAELRSIYKDVRTTIGQIAGGKTND